MAIVEVQQSKWKHPSSLEAWAPNWHIATSTSLCFLKQVTSGGEIYSVFKTPSSMLPCLTPQHFRLLPLSENTCFAFYVFTPLIPALPLSLLYLANSSSVSYFYGSVFGIFDSVYSFLGSATATKHTSPQTSPLGRTSLLASLTLTSTLSHPVLVSGLVAASHRHPGFTWRRL